MQTEISAQHDRINRESYMAAPLVRRPGKSAPVPHQSENAEHRNTYGKQNEQDDGYNDIRFGIKCQ